MQGKLTSQDYISTSKTGPWKKIQQAGDFTLRTKNEKRTGQKIIEQQEIFGPFSRRQIERLYVKGKLKHLKTQIRPVGNLRWRNLSDPDAFVDPYDFVDGHKEPDDDTTVNEFLWVVGFGVVLLFCGFLWLRDNAERSAIRHTNNEAESSWRKGQLEHSLKWRFERRGLRWVEN